MSDVLWRENLNDLLVRWVNFGWTEATLLENGVVRDAASSWRGDRVLVSVWRGATGASGSECKSGEVRLLRGEAVPCLQRLQGSSCLRPAYLAFLLVEKKRGGILEGLQ